MCVPAAPPGIVADRVSAALPAPGPPAAPAGVAIASPSRKQPSAIAHACLEEPVPRNLYKTRKCRAKYPSFATALTPFQAFCETTLGGPAFALGLTHSFRT